MSTAGQWAAHTSCILNTGEKYSCGDQNTGNEWLCMIHERFCARHLVIQLDNIVRHDAARDRHLGAFAGGCAQPQQTRPRRYKWVWFEMGEAKLAATTAENVTNIMTKCVGVLIAARNDSLGTHATHHKPPTKKKTPKNVVILLKKRKNGPYSLTPHNEKMVLRCFYGQIVHLL